MINQKYLDQALRIRKDFKNTDTELLFLKDKLLTVNDDIKSTLDKLTDLKGKAEEYIDEESFMKDVSECLAEFEIQANNVNEFYLPLNEKMENLKKEEEVLFEKLVKEYSHLKEEIIVKEVHKYLRDNGGV
tara:strand:- start:2931 stop:3323 length:393 start_codon:yes stop_codon:yes gene_type:complete